MPLSLLLEKLRRFYAPSTHDCTSLSSHMSPSHSFLRDATVVKVLPFPQQHPTVLTPATVIMQPLAFGKAENIYNEL